MYLQLGDIIFQTLIGFESLSDNAEATYAQHELIGRKPRLQRTGDALREFNGTINFHSSFCTPEDEYAKLEAKRASGEFLALIYGNGTYEGNFVVRSLNRNVNQTDNDGNYISITCQVSLLETEGATTDSQRQAQAQAKAFALTTNRPLPTSGDVRDAKNPALDVMNENKKSAQLGTKMLETFEAIDKATERITDPFNETIEQARYFVDKVPQVLAKMNHYNNVISQSMTNLTSLLDNNPMLETVAPPIRAQVTATSAVLITTQAMLTELASLPTVSTIADALYVLNVQKNSVILTKQLVTELTNLKAASSGVAVALATKVKI